MQHQLDENEVKWEHKQRQLKPELADQMISKWLFLA
jgi:hypothetical protein